MKKHILFTVILLLLTYTDSFSQFNSFSLGGGFGAGEIAGNSTPLTSFSFKLFTDFKAWFSNDVSFRAGYSYARKIDYFLPEDRSGKFYPFIQAISLQAYLDQRLTGKIYLEEGAGLIAINDHTFSDTNEWDYGTAFSFLAGFDFRNDSNEGLRLGASLDYGITFTGTTANFYLVSLQTQIFF